MPKAHTLFFNIQDIFKEKDLVLYSEQSGKLAHANSNKMKISLLKYAEHLLY